MSLVRIVPAGSHPLAELGQLSESARRYAAEQHSKATRRGYASDWRQLAKWATAQGLEAELIEDVQLASYLAHLADLGKAPATIDRAARGIGARLRQIEHGWGLGPESRRVLIGIRRTSTWRSRAKRALTASELRVVLEHAGDGRLGLRNRALFLLGFAGGFRRAELVALNVSDLTFGAEGLRVALRRSKTDQEGRGQEKGIMRGKRGDVCPVASVRAWLDDTGATDDDPVFTAVGRWERLPNGELRRLSAVMVKYALASACRRAGLGSAEYGGHSLRSGFVTQAAAQGKAIADIMRQTGHRSLAQVQRYIRHGTVFIRNASEGILG
jgi:integrase